MIKKLLLPLLLLLILLGGGYFIFDSGPSDPQSTEGLEATARVSDAAEPQSAGTLQTARTLAEPKRSEGSTQTTVELPLEIELELISAKPRLSHPDVPDLDSAASAKLRGSMHTSTGEGARGFAEFMGGPNIGRVLQTDDEGRFGANDLYAGLSLVALRANGAPGALREVVLRENRETQLNVGFGRLSSVHGLVKDPDNSPLPLAKVVMDGQETMTDKDGNFHFRGVCSGKVPLYISKPGFAAHREIAYVTSGMNILPGKLRFNLRRGATLKVVIPERLGGPGPGQLFLTGPLDGRTGRKFPWHLKSPVSMFGGESIEIEDLPAGPMRVQFFRPGAKSLPGQLLITLVEGASKTATIHLQPAPALVGQVTSNGEPVEGALVQLEMPDVSGAAVQAMGGHQGRMGLEVDIYSQMPPAKQKALTKTDGRFTFSAAEEYSKVRYLTARSADGRLAGGVVVKPGQLEVNIDLNDVMIGHNSLVVETSKRWQAIKVNFVVNGKPGSTVLRAKERLTLPDLPEGRYKVEARWRNDIILRDVILEISGREELFLPLPQGAIDGRPQKPDPRAAKRVKDGS